MKHRVVDYRLQSVVLLSMFPILALLRGVIFLCDIFILIDVKEWVNNKCCISASFLPQTFVTGLHLNLHQKEKTALEIAGNVASENCMHKVFIKAFIKLFLIKLIMSPLLIKKPDFYWTQAQASRQEVKQKDEARCAT